jgi:hypothetical protein
VVLPHQITTFIQFYAYILYLALSIGVEMERDAWILGTYVLCLNPNRIDALLIGPAEVR